MLASGPLVGAIETRARLLGGRVTAPLVLTLHAGSAALRCTLELDNQARDHRLRLRCATPGHVETATAGAAFGVARRGVTRPTRKYAGETPVTTAPAHRFVMTDGPEGGIAILAPGFFEYEAEPDSVHVTLLRAVGRLSRDDLPTRTGHAGWPTPVPDAQCLGPERLQLGVTLASLSLRGTSPGPGKTSFCRRALCGSGSRWGSSPARVASSSTATAWCFPLSSHRPTAAASSSGATTQATSPPPASSPSTLPCVPPAG